MKRTAYDTDHDEFRETVRRFVSTEVVPHLDAWEAAGVVDRHVYLRAGQVGLLGIDVPEDLGGGGVDDLRFSAVLNEELTAAGAGALVLNFCGFNDLVAPYLLHHGTAEQQKRWLPPLCAGQLVSAIAMTEPGAGSDLKAVTTTLRTSPEGRLLLTGSKTFISNGTSADLVIVVAQDQQVGGLSLVLVNADTPGFSRGEPLRKVGLSAQDTAELFFDNVEVEPADVLGERGAGWSYLSHNLPRERLVIAVMAAASMRVCLEETLAFTTARPIYDSTVADLATTRFRLAEIATQVEVATTFVDRCLRECAAGDLLPDEAAMAKWWITELQQEVVAAAVQLHGGYGFMKEYRVAREYLDARVSTIYGGTTEVMKQIVGAATVRRHRNRDT